jgi:hypothetical protein
LSKFEKTQGLRSIALIERLLSKFWLVFLVSMGIEKLAKELLAMLLSALYLFHWVLVLDDAELLKNDQ